MITSLHCCNIVNFISFGVADEDDCEDNDCSEHGTCVDGKDTYSCDCDDGYTGFLCDQGICSCKWLRQIVVRNSLRTLFGLSNG